MPRDERFFRLHEAYFLAMLREFDTSLALVVMRRVMNNTLKAAYDLMNPVKGDPQDFARVVGERDRTVGLRVEFPVVNEGTIIYQFHDDPFPGLKGYVDSKKLDATYMDFKVNYLLGDGWSYRTTKHMWNGDPFTEHAIMRK